MAERSFSGHLHGLMWLVITVIVIYLVWHVMSSHGGKFF